MPRNLIAAIFHYTTYRDEFLKGSNEAFGTIFYDEILVEIR